MRQETTGDNQRAKLKTLRLGTRKSQLALLHAHYRRDRQGLHRPGTQV